ncbi:MAG: hypothetical protein ACTSPY_01505 [Candidatus Helarchaeota archaeon]
MADNNSIDNLMEKFRKMKDLFHELTESKSDRIKKILIWAENELEFKRCAIFDTAGLLIETGCKKDDINLDILGAYATQLFSTSTSLKEIFKPFTNSELGVSDYNNKYKNCINIKDILLETNYGTLIITPLPVNEDVNSSDNEYIGFLTILLEQEEIYNLGIIKANLKRIIKNILSELSLSINFE